MSPPTMWFLDDIELISRPRLRKMGWRGAAKTKNHQLSSKAPLSQLHRPSSIDIAHVPIVTGMHHGRRRRRRRRRANRGRFKPHTCIHEPWEPNCERSPLLAGSKSQTGRRGQRAASRLILHEGTLSFFGPARTAKRKGGNVPSEKIIGQRYFF